MFSKLSRLSGQKVLRLLYSRSGMGWGELCAEFGFKGPNAMPLLWCMETLVEAELIMVDGVSQDPGALLDFFRNCLGGRDERKIRVSTHWRRVRSALTTKFDHRYGGKRYQARDRNIPYSLSVRPVFGPPRVLSAKIQIFVAMPFDKSLEFIYKDHIKKVADTLFLSCGRSDDLFSANAVLQDIWSALYRASAVIGECTGRNPNVFYELGIAHTLGKPVILITQDESDVPFDVRHVRFIKYSSTPNGMQHLEAALEETLKMEA